jgi:hypothetical protein
MRPAESGVAGRDAGTSLPGDTGYDHVIEALTRIEPMTRSLHARGHPRPEIPIRRGQTKSRGARAIQDRHLMPERQDLEVQSRARSSDSPKREEQRNGDGGNESSLLDVERSFNQRTAYDVSGRHRSHSARDRPGRHAGARTRCRSGNARQAAAEARRGAASGAGTGGDDGGGLMSLFFI